MNIRSFIGGGWLLVALPLLCTLSCGTKQQNKTQTPDPQVFAPYIKAYTGGLVAPDAAILIDLAE